MREKERELYDILRSLDAPRGRMDVTNEFNLIWVSRNIGLGHELTSNVRRARILSRELLREHRKD